MLKPKNAPRLINHAIEQNRALKRNMNKANDEELKMIQRRIAGNNIIIEKWKENK